MVTGDGHSSFSGELGKMCQYRENQRKRKLYRLLIFRNTAGTAYRCKTCNSENE